MRGLLISCTVLCALAMSTSALAGGIAYLDYAHLLHKAPQIKASNSSLKQEFAPRLKSIKKEQDKLESLRRRIQDSLAGSNPLQRASLIEKLHHTRSALKKNEQDYRSGLKLRRAQLQNNFKQVLDADIKAYAKEHGIELVIKGDGLYAGRAVDITADILNRLRQDYRKAQAQGKTAQKP